MALLAATPAVQLHDQYSRPSEPELEGRHELLSAIALLHSKPSCQQQRSIPRRDGLAAELPPHAAH